MAKVVLITGCSTGIGLSVAIKLAKDAGKYKVFATMRNLGKKDALVNEAGETLNKSLFIRKLDVISDSDVETVVKEILNSEKRIDYVINNAGRGLLATLESTSIKAAQEIMDINLLGVVRVCKAVVPTMKQQNSGHILNVSSVAGFLGVPFNAIYCASKFALEGFSESLAPELRKFNCYISIIAPGPVSTNFASNVMSFRTDHKLDTKADEKTEEIVSKITQTMMKNLATQSQTPEEIADVIIQAMNEEKPKFRYVTSPSRTQMASLKFHDHTGENIVETIRTNYLP